jgi:hypothetical protein
MTVRELIEVLARMDRNGFGDVPVLVPDTADESWVEAEAPVVESVNEGDERVVRFLLNRPTPSDSLREMVARVEREHPDRCRDNPVWRENVAALLGS